MDAWIRLSITTVSLQILLITVAVPAHNIWGHGPITSAVVRAYNEGLGAEPPTGQGVRGQAP